MTLVGYGRHVTKRQLDSDGSLTGEHGELAELAVHMCRLLLDLRSVLAPVDGAGVWMQHWEFADRSGDLAEHLLEATHLAERSAFASSFVVARTALEHQVIDELLLLAGRYSEVLKIDAATHAAYEVEWRAGKRWPDAVSFTRHGKTSTLVLAGHAVKDSTTGEVVEELSPYWRVLEHHNATLGPASVQDLFHDGIGDVDTVKAWARTSADLYDRYLSWSSLLRNLSLNGLVSSREEVALGVHYRFLSSFVHATATGYESIERATQHSSFGRRRRSHLLSELVLLYVVNFAHQELRSWQRFVDARAHLVTLSNRAEIDAAVDAVVPIAGHLWLRCGGPTPYDRMRAANYRVWRAWDKTGLPPIERTGPDQLDEAEIVYYNDVVSRLRALHDGSGVEFTTGFSAPPLW